MNRSIGYKLTRALILSSTLPLVLVCGLLILFEFHGERDAVVSQLATLAAITGSNSSAAVVFHDSHAAEQILSGMRAESHILTACLHDRDGALIAGYKAADSAFECSSRPLPAGAIYERNTVVLTSDMQLEGARIGSISMRSDLSRAESRVGEYVELLPWLLLIAVAATAPLAIRFRRSISAPIQRLAAIASTVSARKDYSLRVPPGGRDEIGSLIETFNHMLGEVGRHAEELRDMNAQLDRARRVAEASAGALALSEGRFHSSFDEAPIGMVIVAADASIVEANRAFQALVGSSREELLRGHMRTLTHPEDGPHVAKKHYELVEGKLKRFQVNSRFLTRDGDVVWARLTASRLLGNNGEPLVIGMIEDLREQKALEEQFRHAQKMEAVGRLAGGVAHDFNNLLTVIKGNTELLMKRAGPESPMRRNLEQARKAADRAATLVDQLLTFSRKQLVTSRVFEVNQSIREMTTMLQLLIGEDIEIVLELSESPAHVNCDPTQLEQIVFNLAVNARDAMPSGGRLVLRTEVRQPSHTRPDHGSDSSGPFVALSIVDTGTGMDEEVQARMFEPFFTTKEVGKGTGLGLSTVYGLVRHAGGRIEVKSAIGEGSTFTVWLPAAEWDGATAPAEAIPASGARPAKETILFVEDEQLVRAIVSETLSERGYTVLEAHNPEHALDIVASHNSPLDLLLTDIVMPQMSGCELAAKVRARHKAIRLLFISGYSDKTLPPGARLVRKPFTPDELLREVRSVLEEVTSGSPDPSAPRRPAA